MIHFGFLIRVEVTCYHRVESSLFAELKLLKQELVEEELCFSFRRKGSKVDTTGTNYAVDSDDTYRKPITQIQACCYCSAVQVE